jgi:hypothetical protein
MPAPNLPDPDTLAAIITNVTKTMCGITFFAAEALEPNAGLFWRIAKLPIKGKRPINVALSSDRPGCTALGAALFSCAPDALDASMIDDSLCELLNMAAGQINAALALDQTLGLPRIIDGTALTEAAEQAMREGVVLRSREAVNLMIWVSEGAE